MCEESLIEPITKKEILCPVHLYSGEEAIATGVCAALDKDDYILGIIVLMVIIWQREEIWERWLPRYIAENLAVLMEGEVQCI